MRYLRFAHALDDMKSVMGKIDVVYFEEVRRHLGTDAAHVYGGFLAMLSAWCEKHSIPYQGVPVVPLRNVLRVKVMQTNRMLCKR